MVSEKIVAKIGKRFAQVQCDFVFRNGGGPITVRMGFPDDDSSRFGMEEMISVYASFKSFVDGKPAKTKLVRSVDRDRFNGYRIKEVSFAKGQTKRVRNIYTVRLADLATGGEAEHIPAVRGFTYVFSTGGSWKGNIDRSEMTVTFEPSAHPKGTSLQVAHMSTDADMTFQFFSAHPARVAWAGPGPWTCQGRTMVLVKTNWNPSEGTDDVHLYFGPYLRMDSLRG